MINAYKTTTGISCSIHGFLIMWRGEDRHGRVWYGDVRQGAVRQGMVWLGMVRSGEAGCGTARYGEAKQMLANQTTGISC